MKIDDEHLEAQYVSGSKITQNDSDVVVTSIQGVQCEKKHTSIKLGTPPVWYIIHSTCSYNLTINSSFCGI